MIGVAPTSAGGQALVVPEAPAMDWTKIIPKDPFGNPYTLCSGNKVCVAIVNSNVHTRIDDLVLCLREAGKEPRLLRGIRVSCCHLEVQHIATEEKSQSIRNRSAGGSVTGWILWEVGCVDQGLPGYVDIRLWIAILVT